MLRSGAPVERRPIAAEEIGGHPDWITAEGDLRTLPFHLAEYDGIDGFYSARLVKLTGALPERPSATACGAGFSLLRNGMHRSAGQAAFTAGRVRSGRCRVLSRAVTRGSRRDAARRLGNLAAAIARESSAACATTCCTAVRRARLYRHTWFGRVPADLRLSVGERWPGDAKRGAAILAGEIELAGQLVRNPIAGVVSARGR